MTPVCSSTRFTRQVLAAMLLASASLDAQDRETIAGLLDRRVEDFSVQGQEARVVLEGIGAGDRFPVIVEPDVKGTVSFEVRSEEHTSELQSLRPLVCRL